MRKKKLTLTLAVGIVTLMGLASCNSITAKDGVLLTYTDENGTRIDYTAKELLDDYDRTSSAAGTNFDKFKEVLIRKYYASAAMKSKLEDLTRKARNAVETLKNQASSAAGGDSNQYLKEMEKIYQNNNVENIDQLYDKKLYEEEEKDFENNYKSKNNKVAMRDGVDAEGEDFFAHSDLFDPDGTTGPLYKGYLRDRLPFHVSHILIKTESATSGNYTEDKISSSEAINLADTVRDLAGAGEDRKTAASERSSFEIVAHTYSQDDGSKANYGELTDKDNTPLDITTNYVPEFKLGLYAYEALFNKHNTDANNEFAKELKPTLLPSDDAKYDDGITMRKDMTYLNNMSIGTIPYGVFAALGGYDMIDGTKQKVADDPKFTYELKNNNSSYYARNVLFNKYLNKHQIAVITPNRIPYNDYLEGIPSEIDTYDLAKETDTTTAQMKTAGKLDADYAKLPGFQYDTTTLLPGIGSNVLTTEKGQVILVARVDSSNYHGIHFIVVNRSSLEQYGTKVTKPTETEQGKIELIKDVTAEQYKHNNITDLSDYYAFTEPSELEFKQNLTYTDESGTHDKTTYVNAILHEDRATYTSKYTKLEDYIGSYNPNLDSYMFQSLIANNQIQFNDNTDNSSVKQAKALLISWIKNARAKSIEDTKDSLDDAWTDYIEMLQQQDYARRVTDRDSKLISETCAIGLKSADNVKGNGTATEWDIGGACYHVA